MCKEPRKEIVLVDYLFQRQISLYMLNTYVYMWMEGRKATDKPCGLAHTDRDFWIYVEGTDFSAYVKGRKDRGKEGRRR